MKIRWNTATLGVAIVAGLTAATLTARADGCCGAASHTDAHCAGDTVSAASLPEPLPATMDNYLKIKSALAKDSLDGVVGAATAISQQKLPADVVKPAETLAKAKDLAGARTAFKALSAALIQQLEQAKTQTGHYYEAYCDMAKASWLQDNKTVTNPYYGQSMARCGEIKRTF